MRRVFMVGCGRSGTTLLQALLGSHPEIVTFPETQWFADNLGEWERRVFDRTFRSARSPLRYALAGARTSLGLAPRRAKARWAQVAPQLGANARLPLFGLSITANLRHFVRSADQFAEQRGVGVWLEKSPNQVFYVRDILWIAPTARFIHVVRTGLAVVASTVDAARRYPDTMWSNFLDPLVAAERWNAAIRATMQFHGRSSHLIVRDEDLVTDPRFTLARCFAFLELPDYPEALRHYAEAVPEIVQQREKWKTAASAPIALARSKADELFSSEEQARIIAALLYGGSPPL